MANLLSGLPDLVAGEEDLARFITSSGGYNSLGAKPSAFMPEIEHRETSVFRHDGKPPEELWAMGEQYAAQGRTIYGAAFVKANNVRAIQLDVFADEPPPRHAVIRNWPWTESDPDLRKAAHKELAILLARDAQLLKK
jgi:hypothetical protein